MPNDNPHQDYRRQTDRHYGSATPSGPPRISRGVPSGAEQTSVEPDQTPGQPDLPTSRFAAGTAYCGRSGTTGATPPPPPPIVAPPPTVPSQEQVMPVVPPRSDAGPTEQTSSTVTPLGATPQQQVMPVVGPSPDAAPKQQVPPVPPGPPPTSPQQQSMPVLPPHYAASAPQTSPPSGAQRFDFQPAHAMWALAILSGLATVVLGLGWILVAGASAYGAWYLGRQRTAWPADIQEILARAGLAGPVPPSPAASPPAPAPYIPFRPMTFPEIFTGAFKVVSRHWPTLAGIPLVIVLAAGLAGALVGSVMLQILVASGDSLFDTTGFGGIFIFLAIFSLLIYAVALPLDALLIALGVITTDKAVRGEHIRMANVFTLARQRMLAVTRLTLAFYSIFIICDLLIYTIVIAAVLSSSLAAGIFFYLLLLAANFVLGMMLSLAPIVVVVEHRGVIDSLQRSIQLVKSAWGRILAINLLWAVCATLIIMIPSITISFVLGSVGAMLFMLVAIAFLLAYTRTLQLLVYTDLRMRQERYEQELIADWARNTRAV